MRSSSVPIAITKLGYTLNSTHASWEVILLPLYSPRSSLTQLSLNDYAYAFGPLPLRIASQVAMRHCSNASQKPLGLGRWLLSPDTILYKRTG
jgi:hypothetical protein